MPRSLWAESEADRLGPFGLNVATRKQAERVDGKFVVHSNDDILRAEDTALGDSECGEPGAA